MKERVFKIGTSSKCEITIPDGIPSNVIWAHLILNNEEMSLLQVFEPQIRCLVNGHSVSNQYWVKEGDVIQFEEFILNWDYINGDSNEPFVSQPKDKSLRKNLSKVITVIASFILISVLAYLVITESVLHVPKKNNDIVIIDTTSINEDIKEKNSSVSSASALNDLWDAALKDTRNSYVLYYLATHYHNRKLDSTATNFWNNTLVVEGDVQKYLHKDNRNVTSERFVFVMLARAYANLNSNADAVLHNEVTRMLDGIQSKYPDKYNYKVNIEHEE